MRYSILILFVLAHFQIFSQKAQISVMPLRSQDSKPWTGLEPNISADEFQFAIVTDRTGGHRPGVFMDGVNKLNLLQPEFVMSVGDLIEGYTENTPELLRQWDEFDGFVNQLQMPFFYVPGNHDITNQVMEDLWLKRRGDTYYAFTYKNVLFLCLNSEDQKRGAGRGTISDEQFDWIKKTLAETKNVAYTLVFMHQPLWTQEDTKRWNDVEALLADRKHNVFTGHYHRYTKYDRNNGKYFVLATTGGGSNLRGTAFGEFDHVVWVTMKKSGPIVANLLLEGIWDENVLGEEMRAEIDKLQDKSPFQFDLVFAEEVKSGSADFNLKITNDDDIPMKVNFEPGISFDQVIFLEKEEITIQPNSVETVKLSLKLKNPEQSNPRPVNFKATVQMENAQNSEVSLPFNYKINAISKYTLLKSSDAVEVNADLSEWKELKYQIKTDNPNDISASFDLRYDDKMLYLAARVKDDKIYSFGSGSPWTQDYIGLCMNADPISKSAMSVGKNWYKDEMYFLQTPEQGERKTQIWPNEKLPEGSLYACKTVKDGYQMEWAIPLTYIEKLQGKDWKTFRFNIMVGDKDTDTEEPEMYFWEPNWRGDENYLGSGMFFKE